MSFLTILAQTGKAAGYIEHIQADYDTRYVLQALDQIWQQATALTWLQAVLAISFGIIPLMYGWRIYKTLTVIGLGLLGLHIGMWLGVRFDKVLLCSIVGAAIFAVLALLLMRWAISVLGAIAGGLLAAGIWHAFGLSEEFVWAGALVGVVAGGMISFAIFKLSVMLFTSFGGASLVIVGIFSLIYQYETFINDPPTTHLNQLYYNNPWFLPLLLICSTLFGIIIQLKFVKGSKDWSL
jgi:hypothetical protein